MPIFHPRCFQQQLKRKRTTQTNKHYERTEGRESRPGDTRKHTQQNHRTVTCTPPKNKREQRTQRNDHAARHPGSPTCWGTSALLMRKTAQAKLGSRASAPRRHPGPTLALYFLFLGPGAPRAPRALERREVIGHDYECFATRHSGRLE